MKKLLSLILAVVMVLGAFPTVAFAGDGEDAFPPSQPVTVMRPESSYSGTVYPEEPIYIDFYSGAAALYEFESLSDYDLYVNLYDSNGLLLATDDDSGDDFNFRLFCFVEARIDVYLEIASYEEIPVDFTLNITTSDVESVEVAKYPSKTEYAFGESLDTSDLEIMIKYTNGTSCLWMPEHSLSPDGISVSYTLDPEYMQPGKNTVYLECYGQIFSYEVFCAQPHFTEAFITKMPDITEYCEGSYYIDPTGMEIELINDGVLVETLTFTSPDDDLPVYFEVYPFELGENTVTAYIYGFYAIAFNLTGVKSNVASIELLEPPAITEYLAGDPTYYLDLAGASVKINYTDNSYAIASDLEENYCLFNGCYFNAFIEEYLFRPGKNTVTLEYCGATLKFDVYGVTPNIERIEIKKAPDSLIYAAGSSYIDVTGAVVEIHYLNNTSEQVTLTGMFPMHKGYEFYAYPEITQDIIEGENTVCLVYAGFVDTFTVTGISNDDIKRITVNTPPKNTSNNCGVMLDENALDGLVLDITYNDGTVKQWDFTENNGMYNGADVYPEYYHSMVYGTVTSTFLTFGDIEVCILFNGIEQLKGDFDGDGQITVADALAALRIAAELAPETNEAVIVGDIDKDYSITVADALAILRVAAQITDTL